jgi:hypothetical protein
MLKCYREGEVLSFWEISQHPFGSEEVKTESQRAWPQRKEKRRVGKGGP